MYDPRRRQRAAAHYIGDYPMTPERRREIAREWARRERRKFLISQPIPELSSVDDEGIEHPIVDVAFARKAGAKFYFTGLRCQHGHLSVRRTSNGVCTMCERLHRVGEYWLDPEKARRATKQYMAQKPEAAGKRDRRAKQWYLDNPDRGRDIKAEWAKRNPDLCRHAVAKRRKRLQDAPGNYTPTEMQELLNAQGWLCANPDCGADLRLGLHRDHITPISRGGSNSIDNMQGLCPACNLRKNNRQAEWEKAA